MRTFYLWRDKDESGVSGTGRVAEGVEFGDGTVVMRWLVEPNGLNVYEGPGGLDKVERVHGHGGKTRVVIENEVDRHLAGLLFLIEEYVSFDTFKNGVEHQGIDEGQVYAGKMIAAASDYLVHKYGTNRPGFDPR